MVAFILTETALQMALMERLVKSHPVLRGQDIRMRTDRGNIAERARSHFVHSSKPVVLVSSPQTVNPRWVDSFVEVREEFIRAAVPTAKFLVLMVPPEVESLLFRDAEVVKAVLPGPVSIEDQVRGRYEALKVLAELFAKAREAPFPEVLMQRLAHADLSRLWRLELLKPLEQFLLESCLGPQQSDLSPSVP